MTAAIEEAVSLGKSMEGTPPCEIKYQRENNRLCGRPSVVRLKFICMGCGDIALRFVCKQCFEDIQRGNIQCPKCSHIAHFKWTEI